jgi:hypothetical protein
MNFKTLKRILTQDGLVNYLRERRNAKYAHESTWRFALNTKENIDIRSDIQQKYIHDSDLLDIFANNKGNVVDKWHHYIPLYDRYFSRFRGSKVRFLEIGVSNGGSLQMWRQYFGEDAILYGIDIDPQCERLNGMAGQVRIGSQSDSKFLASVIKEMGCVDIILDDGSHRMDDITTTLDVLFPLLSRDGIYMIEDLHTAYWQSFGGGYRAKGNFFQGFLMGLIDDMHHWYHKDGAKMANISKNCSGIHVHDSIVVLEKYNVFRPVHSRVGDEKA